MPLVCSIDETRDSIPLKNPASGEIIARLTHAEAQAAQLSGEAIAVSLHNGRISFLEYVFAADRKSAPDADTENSSKRVPIRSEGMGDSHTQLRECSCPHCKENGKPIKRHERRSLNPKGVWTIDFLPRNTRSLFRRPILDCKVNECPTPVPLTAKAAA